MAFNILDNGNNELKKQNKELIAALSDEDLVDSEIKKFLSSIDYGTIKQAKEFINVKNLITQIMELVAQELSANWDDPRYSREIFDE